jgi:MFS transporter, ACS family, tartrate transporter
MDTLEQRTMARVSARSSLPDRLLFCRLFWTLPTAFLSGAAAAGGIAIINSIGNLAGFVGPSVMGMIKDATGSFTNGLLVLVGVAVVALVIVLLLRHDTALERIPELESSRAE